MRKSAMTAAMLCLMLVTPLQSWSEVPAAEEPFAESIEVTVVNVDVVVRDRAGNLVSGLTRDDFKLFVDGKPVEISNFYAASPPPPPAPPAAAVAPAPPDGPGTGTAGEVAAADGAAQSGREALNLVVYVDDANMKPFDRNRVLKQLRGFLEQTLQPGDQLLVVSDNLGLHVRHPFQRPLSALGPELDRMAQETGLGISRENEAQQALDAIHTIGCLGGVEGIAQSHAEKVYGEIKSTYADLERLIQSLGSLNGHKVLLYMGNGVPVHAGADVFGLVAATCPEDNAGGKPIDTSGPLHAVVAAANANRVTLYALEATGLRNYASAATAYPLLPYDLSAEVDADRQDSLTALAKGTGGRAALNANDFSHDLEGLAADVNGGYSLGFTPPRSDNRKMHALKVEVARPHLRLSYRESYRELSPAERLEGRMTAVLLQGMSDNPLDVAMKLGTPTPADKGKVLVPVQLSVPFGKLAMLPQADGRNDRIVIFAAILGSHGDMSGIHRIDVPVHVPDTAASQALAHRFGYNAKLLLEPGRQRVAFVVVDQTSHISSSVFQDLDVDRNGAATPVHVSN